MIVDTLEKIKNMFGSRAFAYQRVFDKENVYTATVLKDLALFCRAHESTFHKDDRVHAALEGRREVWLRIQEYLRLTPEQIYMLHKSRELTGDKK